MKGEIKGVVIVSPGGELGGGGMGTVTRLMKEWMKLHHQEFRVSVIDPRGDGHAAWSMLHMPAAISKLIATRFLGGHNILHLQISERTSFIRKAAMLGVGRLLGMKVIVHHHGAELIPFYRTASTRMRSLVRWTSSRCHVNIVLGQRWRDFLVDEAGIDRGKIVVRPNAVKDIQALKAGAESNGWHFLIAANLSDRKGVGELLEATAILKEAGAPIRLTLAGGGEVERFRRVAESLGIGSRCTFTGWVPSQKMHELLRSGVTLVLPSHNEGLPMSILEAMSAGVPVITTPVGSIPEHLIGEVHCIYVDPGSSIQIALALRRLAEDPALRKSLSWNGRLLYKERFEIQRYMEEMISTYRKLLSDAHA